MSKDEKFTEYPKYVYHKDLCPEGQVVEDEAALKELGSGWVDSPAKFEAVIEQVKSKKDDIKEKK